MHLLKTFGGALALVPAAFAQSATYCSGGACFAVNVPSATASSGSGNIYLQITGPTSMSWIALGQGSRMKNSNIFFVYANAAGTNVTISTRLGSGDSQPSLSTAASVTLLAGSGISGSVMTANIRCSNCNSWSGGSMSFTDTSSNWIWAYKTGSAISSNSVSASLAQHSKYGATTLNLVSAAGGSSDNPFASSGTTSTSTSTASSSSSSSSSNSNSGSSSSGSSSSSDSSSGPGASFETLLQVHGIIGGVAFVIMYPLGAIAIRALSFPGLLWVHAGWMVFTYMMTLACMGLGIWVALTTQQLDATHSIIGLVVVGSLIIQPLTGLVHHLLYKRLGRRNAATHPHVWWGRAVITLGIINGALGLQLSGNTSTKQIAYGVIAGLVWLLWMVVIVIAWFKSQRSTKGEPSEYLVDRDNHGMVQLGDRERDEQRSYSRHQPSGADSVSSEERYGNRRQGGR